jgi:hypothetical protein
LLFFEKKKPFVFEKSNYSKLKGRLWANGFRMPGKWCAGEIFGDLRLKVQKCENRGLKD